MIEPLRTPAGVTYPNPDHLDLEVALDGRLYETEAGLSDRPIEDTVEWWSPEGTDFL